MTKEEGQKAFTDVWRIMRECDKPPIAADIQEQDAWWGHFVDLIDGINYGFEEDTDVYLLRKNLAVGLANYYTELYHKGSAVRGQDGN